MVAKKTKKEKDKDQVTKINQIAAQITEKNKENFSLKPCEALPPCKHLHIVPIEVSFLRVTHPNGYEESPKCEFYVGISLATAFRVRKYFCPECEEIIKAPSIYAEEK